MGGWGGGSPPEHATRGFTVHFDRASGSLHNTTMAAHCCMKNTWSLAVALPNIAVMAAKTARGGRAALTGW